MEIVTERLIVETRGNADVVDITERVADILKKNHLKDGSVTVFVSGSTASITTVEFEPGLVRDLPEAFERLVPRDQRYHHDDTWHDGNGHSHVRASLLGPSLVVPFSGGRLLLGTWQQIVLIDFDTRERTRELAVQVLGR
jgi:secondary thiamine-phosphate synthase enzyme